MNLGWNMKKLNYAIILATMGTAVTAHAEINFRGFGSIVGGQAVNVDSGQEVLGYSDKWDFRQDSLMALQMDADLEDKLSATMQLMGRGRDGYAVEVEWAYLTYEFTDELQLSAGRIRAPFYRYSDFLDVRYAYNWITAPQRVYSFEFPGYDGISLLYNSSFGSVDSSLQFVAGSMDGIGVDTQVIFEEFLGLSWIGTWDWFTARASYLQANLTIPLDTIDAVADGYEQLGMGLLGVAQGLEAFGSAAAALPVGQRALSNAAQYQSVGNTYLNTVDKIRVAKDAGTYMAFGAAVDKGSLIIDSEWIQYDVDESMISETTAYYLTAGWRFGPTVVYATYSREEADAPTDVAFAPADLTSVAASIAAETALPTDPIAAFGGANLQQMAVGLAQQGKQLSDTLAANKVDLVNWHVGVKWDFHPSAAFKVSYENSNNRISDLDGGVIRTAIDIVF